MSNAVLGRGGDDDSRYSVSKAYKGLLAAVGAVMWAHPVHCKPPRFIG